METTLHAVEAGVIALLIAALGFMIRQSFKNMTDVVNKLGSKFDLLISSDATQNIQIAKNTTDIEHFKRTRNLQMAD